MATLKLLCTLMLPLAVLACDSPDVADDDLDDVGAVDEDASDPNGPEALGTAAPEPEQHGLLCVLCVLHGHHEVCGDDGEIYANACWAACHHADVVPEETYYTDADGDGFGDDAAAGVVACGQPDGTVANNDDCDDGEDASFPGNPEICDSLDNNCDGDVDEGVSATAYYPDADGDGFGDANAPGVVACAPPAGTVANDDDCDDGESAVFPGNPEICDQIDNDCDGAVDEGADGSVTYYTDSDGDGFGDGSTVGVVSCEQPAGTAPNGDDCDDDEGASFPGNPELCDGLDNDCNGAVDEGAATGDGEFYQLVGATTSLPEVGKPGAASYVRDCPCGSVAVGISGRTPNEASYAVVSQFSLICERLNGDGTQGLRFATAPVGTLMQGDLFSGECPAGQVLINNTMGVSFNPNNPGSGAVGSIETACAAIEDVLAGQTTAAAVLGPYTNTDAQVQAQFQTTSTCPAGQVARGIYGGSGNIVDRLGFTCQQLILQ